MTRRALGVPLILLALGACSDSGGDGPRAIGATCTDGAECASSFCWQNACLDPEGDNDLDGLINRLETELGTDPFRADTDGDGHLDADELAAFVNVDSDGDGIPDALESATADDDGDCLPNQFDHDDNVHDGDLSPLLDKLCPSKGICGEPAARLKVSCVDAGSGAFCDFSEVPGYEPVEQTCDGRDNDCDGRVDEDLPPTACAATPVALAVNPRSPSLLADETIQLRVTAALDDGGSRDVTGDSTFVSGTPAAATVDAAGLVTAVALGSSEITVTHGELSAKITVSVVNAQVTALAMTPLGPSGEVGGTVQFSATATYEDASSADVTASVGWLSSVPAIATIDAAGLATIIAEGETTITASIGGQVATTQLIGTAGAPTLTGVAITPDAPTLALGVVKALGLTATDSDSGTSQVAHLATWTSDNPAIAAVDASGRVTAKALGTAEITATLGDLSDKATVTVGAAAPLSLRVTPDGATVDAGMTLQLSAFLLLTDGTRQDRTGTATWEATPASVATVSSAGLVTGVSGGAVTIKATSDGRSAEVTLQVVEVAPTTVHVVVTPPTPTIEVGKSVTMSATAVLSDGSAADVSGTATWSVSPSSVASFSGNVLTGASTGTATVKAVSGGITGEATLVVAAPTVAVLGLALDPPARAIPKGASYTFKLLGVYSDGSYAELTADITWEIGDDTVATVDTGGRVVAAEVSSTTVTASWRDFSAVGMVTVTAPTTDFASLAIDPEQLTIIVGTSGVLRAVGTRDDNTTAVASAQAGWSTTDDTIAGVSQLGVVTAVAAGTVTIRAVIAGLLAEATVTVREPSPQPMLVSSRQIEAFVPVRHPNGVPATKAVLSTTKRFNTFIPTRYPPGAVLPDAVRGVHASRKRVNTFVPVPADDFDPAVHRGVLSAGHQAGVEWIP